MCLVDHAGLTDQQSDRIRIIFLMEQFSSTDQDRTGIVPVHGFDFFIIRRIDANRRFEVRLAVFEGRLQIPQDSSFNQGVQMDPIILCRLMGIADNPALIDKDIDAADAAAIEQEFVKERHAYPIDGAKRQLHQDLLGPCIYVTDIEQGRNRVVDVFLLVIIVFLNRDL